MNRKEIYKLGVGWLVVLIAFMLGEIGLIGKGRPDFVLVVLLTLAYFLNFWPMAILSLFSIWILNWQPVLSWEVAALLILPLFVTFGRRLAAGRPWFSSLLGVFMGVLIFYVFLNWPFWFQNWEEMIGIMITDLIFGGLIFWISSRYFKVV